MRDEDFKKVYLQEYIPLQKYFYTCLKNGKYPLPYDEIIHELIVKTGSAVLANSQKETLYGYDVKGLFWRKAPNIWYEYEHRRPVPETTELNSLNNSPSDEPDPLYRLLLKDELKFLKEKIDPETWQIIKLLAVGYKYREIAEMLNQEEGKIKMQVHRVRKRLEKELRKS